MRDLLLIKYFFWGFLSVSSYRMDISKDEESQYCKYRKHLTFKPTATCCANQVIVPGIHIDEHWTSCIAERDEQFETLEDVSWGIYSCILKKSFPEKEEISLQDFADHIMENYPNEIKTKINNILKTQSIDVAPINDAEKLNTIRITYYNAEQQVCENSNKKSTSFEQVDESERCTLWREENHRAGMCCNKAYPLDLKYNSIYEISPEKRESSMEKCKRKLEGQAGEDKLGITDIILNNLLEICEVPCIMSETTNIFDRVLATTNYHDFNVTAELELHSKTWFPSILPSAIIDDAKFFVQTNFSMDETISLMTEYEFADAIDIESNTFRPNHFTALAQVTNKSDERYQIDFVRRRFHKQLIHVPILCSAYTQITMWIDYSIFRNCPYAEIKLQNKTTTVEPPTE